MKTILYGKTTVTDFRQSYWLAHFIDIDTLAFWYDPINSNSGTHTLISGGVYYDESIVRISSEVYSEEVIKDKFANLITAWLDRATAQTQGKILQPDRTVKDAQDNDVAFSFTVKTTQKELDLIRKQKMKDQDLSEILRLLVKKVVNDDLTSAEDTVLVSYISSSGTIKSDYDTEKTNL